MRYFRRLLTRGLGTVAVMTGTLAAQQPARPNVVFIMTDDAGYADLGSYGAKDIRTPNLDRLARDGVRLTDFYANAPSCTPTRAGLITGRYQQRSGLEYPLGMLLPGDHDRGLPVTGRSLPQLMKNAGYATALIGKWHLGWKPEFSPQQHGFDTFYGIKSGFADFYTHTSPDTPGGGNDLYDGDTLVNAAGYLTDMITDRTLRFIEANASRPFFIDVSYNAPHWPYQRPDRPGAARDHGRHLSPFDDSTSTRADYAAMLERVDDGVGRILAAIDKAGVRRNTIVIFTNDNGGEWLARNGPLFNHKLSVWEGGIRVPAIVRWPDRIPAGRVSQQVGMTMDITASVLAAAGVASPELQLDGIDLFPILAGRAPMVERTLFWRAHPARQQRAVRSGNWKLVLDMQRAMLFDLATDIGERDDVIASHTDIARRLRDQLAAWEKDVDGGVKK